MQLSAQATGARGQSPVRRRALSRTTRDCPVQPLQPYRRARRPPRRPLASIYSGSFWGRVPVRLRNQLNHFALAIARAPCARPRATRRASSAGTRSRRRRADSAGRGARRARPPRRGLFASLALVAANAVDVETRELRRLGGAQSQDDLSLALLDSTALVLVRLLQTAPPRRRFAHSNDARHAFRLVRAMDCARDGGASL